MFGGIELHLGALRSELSAGSGRQRRSSQGLEKQPMSYAKRRIVTNKHRKIRGVTGGALAFGLAIGISGVAVATGVTGGFGNAQVDGADTGSGILLPSNQRVTPAGTRALVD